MVNIKTRHFTLLFVALLLATAIQAEARHKHHGGGGGDRRPCCRAFTAECMACDAGMSVKKYCRRNKHVAGCERYKKPHHGGGHGHGHKDKKDKRRDRWGNRWGNRWG